MGNKITSMAEVSGQTKAVSAIMPSLLAAKLGKPMPHVLFVGPPGVGKTMLSEIISKELGSRLWKEDARNLKKLSQFTEIVMDLRHNDVLFIDEFHGLDKKLEELLYNMVDNFSFLLAVGNKQIPIPLQPFVMVGATTRPHEISAPMRTRFGITARLELYDLPTLMKIARQAAGKIGLLITDEASELLSISSRGTARTLLKLIDRADDLVKLSGSTLINQQIVKTVMDNNGIDQKGLHQIDRNILLAIKHTYKNKPVGLSTIAAMVGEDENVLADTVEPYLLREGILMKTTRGRMLTDYGMEVAA